MKRFNFTNITNIKYMSNNTKYDISVKMLKKVLSIQSYSDHTKSKNKDIDMRNYIKSFLSSHNIKYSEDDYGNIYATKGKSNIYPCLVSHVDTVHSIESDFVIRRENEYFYAFNRKSIKQLGTGGDDKVGVFIVLYYLINNDTAKAVFFRNEEVGKLGSKHSINNEKSFYKDCGYIIQPDRKNNVDFITKSGGVKMCSKSFNNKCKEIYKEYGYGEATGLTTDVDTLVKGEVGISCVNIGSGYYRPHTDTEIVSIEDVNDLYNMIQDIIRHLGNKKYPYEYTKPVHSSNNNFKFIPSNNISNSIRIKDYKNNLITGYALHKIDPYSHMRMITYKGRIYYELLLDEPIPVNSKCPSCGSKNTCFSYRKKMYIIVQGKSVIE